MYDLTEKQKEIARWIVEQVQEGNLNEEFSLAWAVNGYVFGSGAEGVDTDDAPDLTKGKLDALEDNRLLRIDRKHKTRTTGTSKNPKLKKTESSRRCTLTSKIYDAVENDFDEPDTSFVRHLQPLSDVTNLDEEIKQRCLPTLGAGAADPKLWDSAVRTAGVILEERLRDAGNIDDQNRVGRSLVNDVFGQDGTLADEFESSSERKGYRDLYGGVVGVFRNPSAHRFEDPEPEDGGAFLVFLNLLLTRLEDIRD